MIAVSNLNYTYPSRANSTINDLSFEIQKSEIFGFLGPSGAGKSTTQKILIGLLRQYHGQAKILGKEIRDWGHEIYERIGVSFELPNHYLKLTAKENLQYFASLYSGKTEDPISLLTELNLEDAIDIPVSGFSKGMKIRLNVARSLINHPEILFLDEPTSGLDPVNSRNIKDLILRRKAKGMTVFITTHNMALADELCDRVAFIVDGKIRLIDSPYNLKLQHGERSVRVQHQNGVEEFPLEGLGDNPYFLNVLRSQTIETIHTQETTLEKIFIQTTGRELA